MRRRTIILLTVLAATVVGIYLLSSNTDADSDTGPDTSVSVAFKGGDSGPPFGVPGFDLTNSGSTSIALLRVWVRRWEHGAWKNSPVTFTTVVSVGQTNVDAYNPVFEPGECRRVVALWPSDGPWRVEMQYAIEMSLISKGEIAFTTRDLSHLTNRSWNGTHYVFSKTNRK